MFALGNVTFACGVRSDRERSFEEEEEEEFSKLAYKIITKKNQVMDGYQKGHMAIQAGGLKKANNNINARKNTVQNKT